MSFIELVAQRHPPKAPAGMQPPENAKDWFRISNSADDPDTTDVMVYDSIGGWMGMWADEFIEQIGAVTTSKINLRLNSPGGSVFEGIAIANAIRQHPANVTVYVDSVAASIASVIALAGDRLVMMPQSQLMVHNASGACYGDASEMTKMADLLDKQSRNIAEAYAQHTGRPLAEWQQFMDAETWFSAEEALAVGLADEVVPMRAKSAPAEENEPVAAQMQRSWDLSMYHYPGRTLAPAPTIPQQVMPGQKVTAELLNGIRNEAPPAEPTPIVIDFKLLGSDQVFLDMIRDLVRKELAPATPAEPAVENIQVVLGGEGHVDNGPEPVTDEPVQADDSPPAPENASTPPPDEDEEEEEEEGDEPPPFTEDEPADEADDWNQIVGFLVSPVTSPGADDVFAKLKEGWS